jgi:hypothetical protein
MIDRYAPDPEYPKGFWFPPQQPTPISNVIIRSPIGVITNPPIQRVQAQVTLVSDPKHILDLALKLSSDGIVETKSIISQLRTEGDVRPDRDMAKSIGNILARYEWKRLETGKYKKLEGKGKEEVKPLL